MAKENIIGRKREQELLTRYMSSGQAEFIAVYGRRRIGKTYLIKQFFDEDFDFYVTGIYDRSKHEQLANFNRQLNKYSGAYYPMVDNWFDAFAQLQHYLETLAHKERIVVFFDELPWLDTPRGKFLTALELFWNEWASSLTNLKFIVCGSATTWMVKKLLGNKGGLHNRVTHPIRLGSFTLAETEEYLNHYGFHIDRLQQLEGYMIFGGTPFYLSMLNPSLSVAQNVDELFFGEGAPLRDEYDFLFRSLFNEAQTYRRIIELLARKTKGMTKPEIMASLKLPDNGNLTEILDNLCQCDFLRKYSAYGKKERGVMFQLIDHFCLFYLRYVKNDNSQDPHRWSHGIDDGARRTWMGYAFEQVCLRHLEQIKRSLGINHILCDVSSWQVDGAQIDLVIERKDRVINLLEMKYTDKPFVISSSYKTLMENRRELFHQTTGTTKSLYLTLVAPFGLKNNKNSQDIQSVVALDDLFCV